MSVAPPKYEGCGCSGWTVHCNPIGSQDHEKVAVPVRLVLAGEDGKLGGQGVVKSFHQPVTLGMERRHPRLVNPQPPADHPKDLGLKVPPLVTVELGGDPKAG